MRDIKRIDRILNRIKSIWLKSPNQRFLQLLINLGIVQDNMTSWNIEDDNLERWLEEKSK